MYVYEGTYLPQNVVNLRKAPMIPGMLCSVIKRDNALDPMSGPRGLVNFKTIGPEIGHVTAKPHSVCVSHREGYQDQEVLWA